MLKTQVCTANTMGGEKQQVTVRTGVDVVQVVKKAIQVFKNLDNK